MKISNATIGSLWVSILLAFGPYPCLCAQMNGPMGPWTEQDIGDTGATGTSEVTNDVFTMSGSGADIWGSADAFHYVYKSWSGDCALVIRVVHVDETDSYARAGIMFRASLDADSPHAFVFHRAGGRTAFQARLESGDNAWIEGSWVNEPYWVKLVRLQTPHRL